jgi:uncharacterized protein
MLEYTAMSRLRTAGFIIGLTGFLAASGWLISTKAKATGTSNPEIAAMYFAPYSPQKVVYHVSESAGLFDSNFKNILELAHNHVAAVGRDWIDLRMILQGDAVDLMIHARTNAALAARIDELRKDGVKFLICRNTLLARNIDPDTKMYKVPRSDIINAGMAEAAELVQQGFVYLRTAH